jgi:hypothetical protein
MSDPRKLRFYGYVDRPYERVRNVLYRQPLQLLVGATSSATKRTKELVAHLRIGVAGVDIGVDVRPTVNRVSEEEPVAGLPPVTCVEIAWEAARGPGHFPLLRAQLSAWPTTSDETQLEIEGDYRPPFGMVGRTLDAILLHRLAQASVHRFLEDVMAQIRSELQG